MFPLLTTVVLLVILCGIRWHDLPAKERDQTEHVDKFKAPSDGDVSATDVAHDDHGARAKHVPS